MLKKFYHAGLKLICSFLPMNNEILLESHPDLTCNTWPLFQYMLKENFNEDFKLTWLVNEPQKFLAKYRDIKNVSFVEIYPKTRLQRIKKYIRCNRAKCIITSNRALSKKSYGGDEEQLNIYLDHGSPLKDCKEIFSKGGFSCDYYISQGPLFIEAAMDQYNLKREQIITLGLPRNDIFYSNPNSIQRLYSDINKFKKVIIWAPTFREHMDKKRIDVDTHYPLGIPIMYTKEDVQRLNAFLLNYSVLLIIKPHPAQDISVLKDFKASNIRFLYNKDLEEHNIQTNELLAQTDALISDYSSIYWDYILLDKPIAITLDDYEQYKTQMGFAFDKPLDLLVGERIYKLDDLVLFIDHVKKDMDIMKVQRNKIKEKVQVEPANESTKRLYEFIVKKLKIKNKLL